MLTINATFDASITAVSGAEAAINAAISAVEADITSPNDTTISIYFTTMSGGLGESLTSQYGARYYDYYQAFKAVATQPNQLTALASLGTAPTGVSSGNPVNGNNSSSSVVFTSAEGRNLGFSDPGVVTPNSNINNATGGGTFDGEIALNTSITSPPNGPSGNYSLQAVATHEIDEVLGIGGPGSTLTASSSLTGAVGVLDLYRYSAPGARSYSNSSTPTPYFSINGGNTVLSYFNQTSGADFGDWYSATGPAAGFGPQVQDAFATPGTNLALGPSELAAFNAVGYHLTSQGAATPEPTSLTLFTMAGLLFSGYGLWQKRIADTARN